MYQDSTIPRINKNKHNTPYKVHNTPYITHNTVLGCISSAYYVVCFRQVNKRIISRYTKLLREDTEEKGNQNTTGRIDTAHRRTDDSTLVCVLVCMYVVRVCFLPIHSGHQVCWTYQPGSHRRKVTRDFSSTFSLRYVP